MLQNQLREQVVGGSYRLKFPFIMLVVVKPAARLNHWQFLVRPNLLDPRRRRNGREMPPRDAGVIIAHLTDKLRRKLIEGDLVKAINLVFSSGKRGPLEFTVFIKLDLQIKLNAQRNSIKFLLQP